MVPQSRGADQTAVHYQAIAQIDGGVAEQGCTRQGIERWTHVDTIEKDTLRGCCCC